VFAHLKPPRAPFYELSSFLSDCGVPGRVVVLDPALSTAWQLGLKSSQEILEWMAAGGAEKPSHWNTEPWKHNPNAGWKKRPTMDNVIWVDAYTFDSGGEGGYLAFMFQPLTDRWLLKSLKLEITPDND
jgi:hypothetical protein